MILCEVILVVLTIIQHGKKIDRRDTTDYNGKRYLNCECQRTVSCSIIFIIYYYRIIIVIIMFNNLDTVQFDQCSGVIFFCRSFTYTHTTCIVVGVVVIIIHPLSISGITPGINAINIVKYLSYPSTRM